MHSKVMQMYRCGHDVRKIKTTLEINLSYNIYDFHLKLQVLNINLSSLQSLQCIGFVHKELYMTFDTFDPIFLKN